MLISNLGFLASIFLLGLFSSLHCAGMCGGIVCALSYGCDKTSLSPTKPFYLQLGYHLGRLFTYALLGALTGVLGIVVHQLSGDLYLLRYLAALFIILAGCYIAGWWNILVTLEQMGKFIWQPLGSLSRSLLPARTFQHAFLLGGLWGFLPCGLIYSALVYSLSTGSSSYGALVMLFFGLGTMPALLLIGSSMHTYQALLQTDWVRKMAGSTLIVFGFLSLYFLTHHQHPFFAYCGL